MNWLAARLREPSTWRGLIWLATACGVTLRPEVWEQITAVGMAVAGLIGVLTSEKPARVDVQLPPIELVAQSTSAGRAVDPADPGTDRRPAPAKQLPKPGMPAQSGSAPACTQQPEPVDQSPGWNG